MSRARRSLGPNVWAYLGSSGAFHRAYGRLRSFRTSFSGEGGGCQEPESRGVRCTPRFGSPSPPGVPAGSGQVLPVGGRRTGEGQAAGWRKTGSQQAGKGGTPSADRRRRTGGKVEPAAEEGRTGEEGKEEREEGRWDQRLSEKTALVVDAAMWTIATERERAATIAAIARESARSQGSQGQGTDPAVEAVRPAARGKDSKAPPRVELAAEDSGPALEATAATTPATAPATATELRVSLPTARRFVKRSRLVDGVAVLDADVDLAFGRWEEEARRSAEREPTAPAGDERGVGAPFAEPAAGGGFPQKQRLCEAVGCSDPARYGDFHPAARARLCRKHRRNGMVDVGSRRSEKGLSPAPTVHSAVVTKR